MKKSVIFLFFAFSICSLQLQAQSADAVINQYIEANGGLKKLTDLKTIQYNGVIESDQGDIHVKMSIADKRGIRVELDIDEVKNIQFANSKTGYSILPSFGMDEEQEMTPETLLVFQEQMELESPLINYAEKGHSIEHAGIVELGNVQAHKLELQYENGNLTSFFIDVASGFILKQIQIFKIGTEDVIIENEFSDYRKNDAGYVFAHSIKSELGTMRYEEIKTNPKLEDSLFEKAAN